MAKLVLVARDTWDGLLFSFFSGEVITLNILRGVVMVALASEIVLATEKDVRTVRGSGDDDDSLCLLSLLDFTFFIALSILDRGNCGCHGCSVRTTEMHLRC